MSTTHDFQARRSSTLKELSTSVKSMQAQAQFEEVRQDIQHGSTQSDRIHKLLDDATLSAYAYREALRSHLRHVILAWQTATRPLPEKIDQEAAFLRGDVHALTILLNQAMDAPDNEAVFDRCCHALETEITTLKAKIQATRTRLEGIYEAAQSAMKALEDYMSDLQWTMEMIAEAQVDFESGEEVYVACKAAWVRMGHAGDDPDGILYVTNKRLLFEQKETKGKFLGLFGGKKVHSALWEATLAQLRSTETERRGIIGGKAMLSLTFSPDAPQPGITLEVKGGFGNERLERMMLLAQGGKFTPPLDVPEVSASPATSATTQSTAREGFLGVASAMGASVDADSRPYPTPPRSLRIEALNVLGGPDSPHPFETSIAQIAVSADGRRIASRASMDVRMWDVATSTMLFQQKGEVNDFALSPDGTILATRRYRDSIRLLDATTGAPLRQLAAKHMSMAFSPDGQWLASTVAEPNALTIYRVSDGTVAFTMPLEAPGIVDFSSDGKQLLVSASVEVNPMAGTLLRYTMILDIDADMNVTVTHKLKGLGASYTVKITSDGQWLMLDQQLVSRDGKQTHAIVGTGALFGGRLAMLAQVNMESLAWMDLAQKQTLFKLPPHRPYVTAYALSADTKTMVTSYGGPVTTGGRAAGPCAGLLLWKLNHS
jgi:hypothetical protein